MKKTKLLGRMASTVTKKKPLRKSEKSAGKPPTESNRQSAIGNPQSPELPLPGLSQPERPIPAWARAEEFLTGITTADLWNIHHENPPTGAPWFPKPVKSLWHVRSVITGLLARAEHRAQRREGFPAVFATQQDFARATTLSVTLLDFLRKKSGEPLILPGGRVDFAAVLRALAATELEHLDYIDGDYEDKRLIRERADEQAMLNAEKRGDVLFNRDQTAAIGELSATEILYEQFLAPFKKELLETSRAAGCYDPILALLEKYRRNLPPEMVGEKHNAKVSA